MHSASLVTKRIFWLRVISAYRMPRLGSRRRVVSIPPLWDADPAPSLRPACGKLAPHPVVAVHERRDAIAERRGLRLGRGRVVGQAHELDRPAHRVEDRELGELVAVLALRVDRPGTDEVELALVQFDSPLRGHLLYLT